jgi:hypothetical protein
MQFGINNLPLIEDDSSAFIELACVKMGEYCTAQGKLVWEGCGIICVRIGSNYVTGQRIQRFDPIMT